MSTSALTTLLGSTLPPHLSGASPTTFYYGNMVWQNIVETGKKIFEQKKNQPAVVHSPIEFSEPITILNDEECGYTELHQVAFVEGADERMVVESVPFDKLNARDKNGNTPLMWATSQGDEQLVELLVDQGSAVNLQNFVGETALFIGAARGFEKICTFLIENGGDTRTVTLDGATPLHIASAGGHLDVVKTLVSHGAFVNVVDEEGDTPLHYAVREGKRDVIEILVKFCGADFNLKNEDEESPLDLSIELEEKEIVDFFSQISVSKSVTSMESSENRLYFGEENEVHANAFKEYKEYQVHQPVFLVL